MMTSLHSLKRIPARHPLAVFVAVSFLVHLTVILYSKDTANVDFGSHSRNDISVQIKNTTASKSTDHKPEASKNTKTLTQRKTTEELAKLESDHIKNKSNQPAVSPASLQQKILGNIQQEIARYFFYPPQALRRGFQGQVLIGFNVSRDGKIYSVVINKSSGYPILDKAALQAFNQATQNFTSQAASDHLNLQIPVQYQIAGG